MAEKQPEAESQANARRRGPLRGESTALSFGVGAALLVFVGMGATAWWTARSQRSNLDQSRKRQIEVIRRQLCRSAENKLASGDLSTMRREIGDDARMYHLRQCRVVLPDGRVVADADPSRIDAKELPAKWPGNADATAPADTVETINRFATLEVPGRGTARLEIIAEARPVEVDIWRAQGGVGAIAAGLFVAVLVLYRLLRRKLRDISAVQGALLARADGEQSGAVLSVDSDLGPASAGWNEFVQEHDWLRSQGILERTREAIASNGRAPGGLAAACDTMPQGILLINADLTIAYANGAAASHVGGKRDGFAGKDVTELIEAKPVLDAIRAAANGAGSRRATIEQQDADGAGVLRWSIRPMRGDGAAMMVLIEDITQQRVAEESRNAFVAQATHELRTPLTNIRLYVEMAIEQSQDDPNELSKSLNVINQETRRLDRIVGDILSVSEIEAGSLEVKRDDVRLDEMLREVSDDYRAQATEKKIELLFDLPPKLPVIQGDQDKISVALHNLLGNALKYTPAEGKVDVTVDVEKSRVLVEVADTGIGISDEDAEHIFDKFYRAKDQRLSNITGSGLGLALAREVIRLHGGDITVHSELNKGSTFTLMLPTGAEAA